MQGDTYLFVDGAYLREQYTRAANEWFGHTGDINFEILIRTSYMAQKTFYYDCLDDIQRSGEGQIDFEARVATQKQYFGKIGRVTATHVRLGTLKGQKEKRQKEVDILLAVDIMNHAVRRNMSTALLLSGDMDFRPVVKSLVEMGLTVGVVADRRTVSEDLTSAADFFRPMTMQDYHYWSPIALQIKYPIPGFSVYPAGLSVPPGATQCKQGVLGNNTVKLYQQESGAFGQYFLTMEPDPGAPEWQHQYPMMGIFPDPDRFELYARLQYGEITWQATAP
jgi:uncharacterized LabA/DUF88 family protein